MGGGLAAARGGRACNGNIRVAREGFGARAVFARRRHARPKSAEHSTAALAIHALRPETGRAPLGLRLRRPVLQLWKLLARREEFARSAAVCAEHQPQQGGPRGRR